jgi:hypothetical protein
MNGTDRLASDLPSPPVDALDGVIDGLNHVIPVFDERQPQRGVNTRYIWAFSSFLDSEAQRIESTTQYTRRKQIIPATPKMLILKETAEKADREIDFLYQQECASENENAIGRRFLFGLSQGHTRGLRKAIARLESHWGSFDIWVQRPGFATCESLIRAWEQGEADFEDYLTWFCKHELHCDVDPRRDDFNRWRAYVAQAILGMGVSRGQIHLRPAIQGLADIPEPNIFRRISAMARARKVADENGENDLLRIGSDRRFDALDKSGFMEEIDHIFPSVQMSQQTVMGTAVLEALTREDFERIGRKVGLTKEQSRFMARWFWGRAHERDNPGARIAIRRHQDAIVAAMEKDPVFSRLFG